MREVADIDSGVCQIVLRGLFIDILLTSIFKIKKTEELIVKMQNIQAIYSIPNLLSSSHPLETQEMRRV